MKCQWATGAREFLQEIEQGSFDLTIDEIWGLDD